MKLLKEKIYDDLFLRILDGQIKPGELIRENALVDYYQVSRAPVREALLMLCTEGVLQSIPRCGYQIVPINEKDIEDIIEYRLLLECSSLRANWDKLTDDFFRELVLADKNQMVSSPLPVAPFWKTSAQFHSKLISLSGNDYAVEKLQEAIRKQFRAFAQYVWRYRLRKDIPQSDLGHRALLETISRGDREASVEALEADIRNFKIYDRFFR